MFIISVYVTKIIANCNAYNAYNSHNAYNTQLSCIPIRALKKLKYIIYSFNIEYMPIQTNSAKINNTGIIVGYTDNSGADVTQNITFANKTTSLDSGLNVTAGDTVLSGALATTGATNLANVLNVAGVTTVHNTLSVDGVAIMGSSFDVTGAANLANVMNVADAAAIHSTLVVDQATILGSTLTVANATALNNTLAVSGVTTLNTVNVAGVTNLNSALNVANGASLNSSMDVISATHMHDTLLVDGVTIPSIGTAYNGSIPMDNAHVTYTIYGAKGGNLIVPQDANGAQLMSLSFFGTGAVNAGGWGKAYFNFYVPGGDGTWVGATSNQMITIDMTYGDTYSYTLTGGQQLDVYFNMLEGWRYFNAVLNPDNSLALKITYKKASGAGAAAVNLGNTMTIAGATVFNNNLTVNGTAALNGAITISGALGMGGSGNVVGTVTLGSTFDTIGVAHLKSTVDVANATTFGNTLAVTGATNMNTLNVALTSHLSNTLVTDGAATMNSSLAVTGVSNLNNTLNVAGAATLSNTLLVDKAATMNNSLAVAGATNLGNVMNVAGAAALHSTLVTDGATTVGGTLTVTGVANMNTTLNVTGASALSTVNVTGATTLNSTLGVTNAATMGSLNVAGVSNVNSTLAVTGAATFQNNVTINGNMTVLGNQTAIDTVSLQVKDNAILISDNNTSDALESGIMVQYKPTGSTTKYAGIKRLPASSTAGGEFVFFKDADAQISDPDSNSSNGYAVNVTTPNLNMNAPNSWFKFENNLIDSGSSPILPSINGSVSYVSGMVGANALNIVNTAGGAATNYIQAPISPGNNFTVSCYIKFQSLPGSGVSNVISLGTSSQSLFQIQYINIGYPYIGLYVGYISPSSAYSILAGHVTPYTINLNTWYQVTCIFQATGLCSVYVNNALLATATGTGLASSITTLCIGNGLGSNSAFNGCIDDLRIYKSAITFTPIWPTDYSLTTISTSGSYQLAYSGNILWMSSTNGSTWTNMMSTGLPALSYTKGSISSDGKYILIGATNGEVYLSTDSGVTFKIYNNMYPSPTITSDLYVSSGYYGIMPFQSAVTDVLNKIASPGVLGTPVYSTTLQQSGRGCLDCTANSGNAPSFQLSYNVSLNTNDVFSISFWLKPIYNPRQYMQGMVFQLTNGPNSYGYEFNINNDNSIITGYSGIGYYIYTQSNAINCGVWNHIGLTFSGNTNTLYINGIQYPSTTNGQTGSLVPFSASFLSIAGCHNGAYSYKGYIQDFRIYNRAITMADLQSNNYNLYSFDSFTFTSNSLSGKIGPSSLTYNTSTYPWISTYLSLSNGIQQWIAPKTGLYSLTAAGASGGNNYDSGYKGGNGTVISNNVLLTAGSTIFVLVGQRGNNGTLYSGSCGGGGGGTFIVMYNGGPTSSLSSYTILLIAGGGGGGGAYSNGGNGVSTTTGGIDSLSVCIPATNGQGGNNANSQGWLSGNGGGGFIGNGAAGVNGNDNGTVGISFLNGGYGGTGYSQNHGGFGGGAGSGSNANWGAGGGGGYSGGSSSAFLTSGSATNIINNNSSGGGGGGSYDMNGTNYNAVSSGLNNGNGYATITITEATQLPVRYPPIALSANTTTVSGQYYGNGTYITSSSSNYVGEDSYRVFDYTSSTAWTADSWQYYSSGTYSRSPPTTTLVESTVYSGEWLQIQLPTAIVLSKYTLYPWKNSPQRMPTQFIIAGSNDGTTWSLVDTQNNNALWTSSGKSFTINKTNSYNYYRLITFVKSTIDTWLGIGEWILYQTPTPDQYLTTPFISLPFEKVPENGVNGNTTLTVGGSPSLVTGVVNANAINLANSAGNGASNYIRGTWTYGTNFTVSFWFNLQSYSSNPQVVFCIGNSNMPVYIAPTSNVLTYVVNSEGVGGSASTPFAISLNTWYNCTLIYQTASSCYFYVNNTLISTIPVLGAFTASSGSFGLGTYDTASHFAFNGYIDDFKIYNSAIAFTPSNVPTIQLTFDGTLVDANGTTIATANGSPSYVTGIVGTSATSFAANTSGGAASYYITLAWPGSSNFTLSGWFNANSFAGTTPILFSSYNGSVTTYINNSGVLTISFPTGGNSGTTNMTSSAISLNTWYNFTYIFQTGGLCSFYLNNVLVGSFTNVSGVGTFATSAILIGAGTSGNYAFKGYIDDFKVYNSAIPYKPITVQSIATKYSYSAVSDNGQYMLVGLENGNLLMSSDHGTLWSEVTSVAGLGVWSGLAISSTGQYMIASGNGQSYSTNYGSTWTTVRTLPTTGVSISGDGHYAIASNDRSAYIVSNYLAGFSTTTYTTPALTGINAAINGASVSSTGKYIVLCTGGTTNNLYYSTNNGATFLGMTVGSSPIVSCIVSANGSSIIAKSATMVYTLTKSSLSSDVYAVVLADSFKCASDRMLKKNIVELDNVLTKLDGIHGVYHNWIDENQPPSRQIGVIAQEVQSIYPELITVGGNGYLSVNYPKLTAVLLQSVKELKMKVLEIADRKMKK